VAQIISLAEYKAQAAQKAVARYWHSLFKEPFNAKHKLSDFRPKTLCYLAEPGDESTTALYSLIIGFSGFSETTTFECLDSRMQNHILDIHLFLSDQIRFEMMFRLGWLEKFVGNQYSLYKMVTGFEHIQQVCLDQPPSLAKDHPDYPVFAGLFERDQQVFIRRMMVSALEAFKRIHKLK
jgi:hypothetical protein